jgi:indolepyruvate ferredoxin oxidoreductase
MIVDTTVSFPDAGTIRDRIDESTRRAVYFDAGHIARELFANEQCANMILVGAAYQAGAIPLTAAAIEQAITLNGAAVETNLQAFRRGRQVVCDPLPAGEMITRRTSSSSPPPPPHAARVIAAAVQAAEGSELARIFLSRACDLVEYQNDSYAKKYTDFVEQVRVAE